MLHGDTYSLGTPIQVFRFEMTTMNLNTPPEQCKFNLTFVAEETQEEQVKFTRTFTTWKTPITEVMIFDGGGPVLFDINPKRIATFHPNFHQLELIGNNLDVAKVKMEEIEQSDFDVIDKKKINFRWGRRKLKPGFYRLDVEVDPDKWQNKIYGKNQGSENGEGNNGVDEQDV